MRSLLSMGYGNVVYLVINWIKNIWILITPNDALMMKAADNRIKDLHKNFGEIIFIYSRTKIDRLVEKNVQLATADGQE